VRVQEHTITLAEGPVFYRTASPEDGGVGASGQSGGASAGLQSVGASVQSASTSPLPLYLHGAPTSSDDWIGLLERTGGLAPDLLGFGRSAKGGHLEYSPESLADFVNDLLGKLAVERVQLVLQGWGTAAGVLLAARYPERVERIVMFNSLPLLPGLTWPWWARQWRIRAVGELAMGSTTKTVLARWLRRGASNPAAWPADRIGQVWDQFDQGTQRAILRLQRSVDDERERTMAAALDSLQVPVLVIWGERDPWWGAEVLEAYTARLPGARIERLAEASHWPWLDDPAAIGLVTSFLGVPDDH
jgi:pimeloyl-ACP methyl ester carboxylesterase